MRHLLDLVRVPLDDYICALRACLTPVGVGRLGVLAVTLAVSWWIYVPIHELAHALGCWLSGGTVTRLEIAPLYGAALLRRVFPFVSVGSAYAGRLSGFDTHGRDVTYLATDFCPYLLTILVGVPLLRSVRTSAERPLVACAIMGAVLPIAYAPFVAIPGDYYEMGSIIVSRLVATVSPTFPVDRWRSDDVFDLGARLFRAPEVALTLDLAGVLASLVLGALLAWLTYGVGVWWARLIGASPRVAPRGARRA